MKHLQQILIKALQRTAPLWSPLKDAYALVHQASQILANEARLSGAQVRERYLAWIGEGQPCGRPTASPPAGEWCASRLAAVTRWSPRTS